MIELINSDAGRIPLKDKSVHCAVTSPPYYGLRNYNVDGQLGHERTVDEYVEKLVNVFREVKRVLRDDGTLWLNMGDCYSSNRIKDLVGVPWKVAFALQEDGWWIRSDIVWHKPNPMPESIHDRPTRAHEFMFLLTKNVQYYYDAEAVREPFADERGGMDNKKAPVRKMSRGRIDDHVSIVGWKNENQNWGKNRRDVWTVSTVKYNGNHFAAFPPKLIEPCIKAGTSEKGCCPKCGDPWRRAVVRTAPGKHESERQTIGSGRMRDKSKHGIPSITTTVGWEPTCMCDMDPVPCIVLDPFVGSGTTLMVARQLKRSGIGIDLNYSYLHEQARERLGIDKLKRWIKS